jgi:phosphinothricin acetyltransferase
VLAIYNQVIATSTAIYADLPVTLDDRQAWWQSRVAQGYPVLVAVDGSEVIGFASFGDFRAWPATGLRWSTASTFVTIDVVVEWAAH